MKITFTVFVLLRRTPGWGGTQLAQRLSILPTQCRGLDPNLLCLNWVWWSFVGNPCPEGEEVGRSKVKVILHYLESLRPAWVLRDTPKCLYASCGSRTESERARTHNFIAMVMVCCMLCFVLIFETCLLPVTLVGLKLCSQGWLWTSVPPASSVEITSVCSHTRFYLLFNVRNRGSDF